jgi:nitronate monooxygenase
MPDLVRQLDAAVPVVVAPMAGGPSTPGLVAAVSNAGGVGILPAGYQSAAWLAEQIAAVRTLTGRPFGVNLFLPGSPTADERAIDAYADRIRPTAERLGTRLGTPNWDDDDYPAKLAVLDQARVSVVSVTFGCPARHDVERLQAAGSAVVVTVTSAAEARQAEEAGADGLCVQGAEAGAHQGSFIDGDQDRLALLDLLDEVTTSLPVLATGGLMTGRDLAGVLARGAFAGQFGTAFLACPEAGTNATHRAALTDERFTATAFTRAFTGRTARGLVNAFLAEHTGSAPRGYPQVHHLTRPVRAAASAQGDADALHLWAGTGWRAIRPMPATDLVALLATEAG